MGARAEVGVTDLVPVYTAHHIINGIEVWSYEMRVDPGWAVARALIGAASDGRMVLNAWQERFLQQYFSKEQR